MWWMKIKYQYNFSYKFWKLKINIIIKNHSVWVIFNVAYALCYKVIDIFYG